MTIEQWTHGKAEAHKTVDVRITWTCSFFNSTQAIAIPSLVINQRFYQSDFGIELSTLCLFELLLSEMFSVSAGC